MKGVREMRVWGLHTLYRTLKGRENLKKVGVGEDITKMGHKEPF